MSSFEQFNTFKFSGREVRGLMRKHGVTVRDLAARMQITQKRVREVRAKGVIGVSACDFYEWITGALSPRMKAAFRSFQQPSTVYDVRV